MTIHESRFDLKALDRKAFALSMLAILLICAPFVFVIHPLMKREGLDPTWYTVAMVAAVFGYLLSYLYIIQKGFLRQKIAFATEGGALLVMRGAKTFRSFSLPVTVRSEVVYETINRYTSTPALMVEISDGKRRLSISEIIDGKTLDIKKLKIWQSEMVSADPGTLEKLKADLSMLNGTFIADPFPDSNGDSGQHAAIPKDINI